MNVQVGSLCDPSSVQGLAHLCEHMLFLGSEKYPKETEFYSYTSQNGGRINAVTDSENTNYYFDINSENLEAALDRFSQIFFKPLFNESTIQGEIININSEYERNVSNDYYRIMHIEKFFAKPNNSFAFFSTGNIKSLKTIPEEKNLYLRMELIKFHEKWYSANLMTLCVFGKENLNELESMVVAYFAQIQNKNVKYTSALELPYETRNFNIKLHIVPISNYRNLSLSFMIPNLQNFEQLSQTDYITYLLHNESEGSLISALKEKRWCTYLFAGLSDGNKGINFYGLEIRLTEEGFHHIDDIITLVFQYINMLKSHKDKEWLLNEYAAIQNLRFRFMEKIPPRNYVKRLSQNMVLYPIENALSGPYLLQNFQAELVRYIFGFLRPEFMRIVIVAKEYETIATEVEPWYQGKFFKDNISRDVILKWRNANYIDTDFKIPNENEFIPTVFDMVHNPSQDDRFPRIIHNTALMRVWFKQNSEFHLPRGVSNFHFKSPFAYVNPAYYNNCVIFTHLVEESLRKYSYFAHSAGSRWIVTPDNYGFKLFIESYSDKHIFILNKVMHEIANLKIVESQLQTLKDEYIEELKNLDTKEPYHQAPVYLKNLLFETIWTSTDLLNASDKITVEYLQDFLGQLFSNMHVEGFIYGNFTEYDAVAMVQHIEYKLSNISTYNRGNLTPLLPSQLTTSRVVRLEPGYHYLYEVENKISKNSCTLKYYQFGLQDTRTKTLLELFLQIISDPLFTILRQKEKLSYIVEKKVRTDYSALGFTILVQSSKHPQYIEERIDNFIDTMKEYIINMTDEKFEKLKDTLESKMHEKPVSMVTLFDSFWKNISTKTYDFVRNSLEPLFLANITKNDIIEFFELNVDNNSKCQNTLSIHVISNDQKNTEGENNQNQSTRNRKIIKIDNIEKFKSQLYLFPFLPSFLD
ncbi:insulin-degrading enzyme-like [Leptopilina heterotoma]|uniref:insulin-degrading enzyme-like n=1 Tax=Leptopilina heterotoma TaxID=63436 RepID=UPI001CA971E1|nr:insulin-degrading enzyme-like [Leptopilina heterotoma]